MTSGTARRVSTWNNGLLVVSEMMNDFRLSRISCKYTPNVFNFVHHFANRNREESAFKERYTYYGKATLKSIYTRAGSTNVGALFGKHCGAYPGEVSGPKRLEQTVVIASKIFSSQCA